LVQAQSKSKKADEILKEVTEKTKSYKSIEMEFDYRMENPEANINELTRGKVLVSGDKYRLEIAGQLVISDSETIWTVIEDAEEVQINEVYEDNDSFSPTKMLSDYSEDYKSKLDPKVDELNGISVFLLELTPNDKKTFRKVNLFVKQEEMQPYRMEIFDYNNSTYTYTITSFKTDLDVTDDDFRFSEEDYPDFDLIDMR
jgi:outer membrane lipoprotein-sorting protein